MLLRLIRKREIVSEVDLNFSVSQGVKSHRAAKYT
jgi:hypothetical protein